MKVNRRPFSFRRFLLGVVCGIAAGPLVVFATLAVRSNYLVREYEVAMLTDGTAESDTVGVRIDGVVPVRRQLIDLPGAGRTRLALFVPHGRRTEGATLEIVRKDGDVTTVLRNVPLEYPSGDTRCVVVVTVTAGIADAGPCRSLLRYM